VDKKNKILLKSKSPGEKTSDLPFVTEGPQDQGKQKKKGKEKLLQPSPP
jgi:hypothetical protein